MDGRSYIFFRDEVDNKERARESQFDERSKMKLGVSE